MFVCLLALGALGDVPLARHLFQRCRFEGAVGLECVSIYFVKLHLVKVFQKILQICTGGRALCRSRPSIKVP